MCYGMGLAYFHFAHSVLEMNRTTVICHVIISEENGSLNTEMKIES